MGIEGYGVLVTGGGSGIGLGVARRLAEAGAHVTICGRTADKLRSAAAEISDHAAHGARVGHVVADVTDEDAVTDAVTQAVMLADWRLDAVVAAAGGMTWAGPITQFPAEQWRAMLDTNLTGAMLTLKHSAAVMARAGAGSFVGISSIAGVRTHRWFGAYGTAKAGLDHLCRTAADELGPSGVRVNCVRPGLIDTGPVRELAESTPGFLDEYRQCTPLPRLGTVRDVAELVRFLVGPESAWITGQAIDVDGGHTLRRGPDLSPLLEPVFGADGLRGAVPRETIDGSDDRA